MTTLLNELHFDIRVLNMIKFALLHKDCALALDSVNEILDYKRSLIPQTAKPDPADAGLNDADNNDL
jgi:hypothetical protein